MILTLFFTLTVVALLTVTGFLHLARDWFGDKLGDWLCRAPGLDVVVFTLTVLPQLVGLTLGGLRGGFFVALGWLAVAVLAQCVAMIIWMRVHELAHREAMQGPRITQTLNRTVGPVRNTLAVWWTAWAVPLFALVRLVELTVYPIVAWLIQLPTYDAKDWVSVSRQKHHHLVGADRIWCLYCDWMTGVWSLGSEMLRNIESFWCPIRFRDDTKCENCSLEFPDVKERWSPADGTMRDVTDTLEKYYPGPGGVNGWFGHPNRSKTQVTVEGKTAGQDESTSETGDQS
ncbi:MAG: hypothetical protein AAF328_11815 [Planctomycetota bacterium]